MEGTGSSAVKTFYHVHHQGSVTEMTDGSGNLLQQIVYDECGQSSSAAACEAFRSLGAAGIRRQYYSPELGRFVQPDPIGNKDDLNFYGVSSCRIAKFMYC
jgi:uncharacterized protein RhaS with RHS repeats